MRKGHRLASSPLLVLKLRVCVQGLRSVAYSPLGQGNGGLLALPEVLRVAEETGRSPAQARPMCNEFSTPNTGVCSSTNCVMNCSLPSQSLPDHCNDAPVLAVGPTGLWAALGSQDWIVSPAVKM